MALIFCYFHLYWRMYQNWASTSVELTLSYRCVSLKCSSVSRDLLKAPSVRLIDLSLNRNLKLKNTLKLLLKVWFQYQNLFRNQKKRISNRESPNIFFHFRTTSEDQLFNSSHLYQQQIAQKWEPRTVSLTQKKASTLKISFSKCWNDCYNHSRGEREL